MRMPRARGTLPACWLENYDEAKGMVAHTALHHSRQYPSEVTLTVVKRAD